MQNDSGTGMPSSVELARYALIRLVKNNSIFFLISLFRERSGRKLKEIIEESVKMYAISKDTCKKLINDVLHDLKEDEEVIKIRWTLKGKTIKLSRWGERVLVHLLFYKDAEKDKNSKEYTAEELVKKTRIFDQDVRNGVLDNVPAM